MLARGRTEIGAGLLAALLGLTYLLLPRMGTDLAAQSARAGFFAAHAFAPVDLRWYGGIDQLGYSLLSPAVMALLGVRATGALTLLAAAVTLAALLRRTAALRPLPAALLGAVTLAGNLVSGRITYGLGVLLGLLALLALTHPRTRWLAAVAALLAAATSPVAGLFLGLAGAALLATRRIADGLLLALPAAVPLALSAALFSNGGWMNFGAWEAARATVTSLLVAALVPHRPVRVAGALSAAGVLTAAIVHTPVGLNATRLVVMFALPVLAGYATIPRLPHPAGLIATLTAVCCWQPPVVLGDVADIGNPTADPAYFTPLRARLAEARLTGRLEIPPTRDYWEAAALGDVPLARGWLRQADIDRSPLFFTTVPGAAGTGVPLTAGTFRAWLSEQAVQYVAVPDAELSWPGKDEAAMVRAGLPYLTAVWSSAHWHLYAVTDPRPIVAPPATLVTQTAAALTFDAPAAGDVPVRVRYHRRLHTTGNATTTRDGDWTLIRVPAPGRYTLTS